MYIDREWGLNIHGWGDYTFANSWVEEDWYESLELTEYKVAIESKIEKKKKYFSKTSFHDILFIRFHAFTFLTEWNILIHVNIVHIVTHVVILHFRLILRIRPISIYNELVSVKTFYRKQQNCIEPIFIVDHGRLLCRRARKRRTQWSLVMIKAPCKKTFRPPSFHRKTTGTRWINLLNRGVWGLVMLFEFLYWIDLYE